MLGINRFAVQSAFIAIAARLAGSLFRIGETFNSTLREAKVVMPPQVVIKRESITLGLAWMFALLTNIVITPFFLKRGVTKPVITFVTAILGTAFAETTARAVAYRRMTSPQGEPVKLPVLAPLRSPVEVGAPALPRKIPPQIPTRVLPPPLAFPFM